MANGFGSLHVGSSGLRGAQNALNVVANNLSNIDTKGYVRQQVIFEDRNYQKFDVAAVAKQKAGLGVDIGDVVHARDAFIDRAYRTTFGRRSFYQSCFEGTQEVETLLRELSGAGYSDTVNKIYESMAEFAKDPSDTANQSVLLQTASLFLEQTKAVYKSIKDYQTNLNNKIVDITRQINDYSDQIYKLNVQIQRVEAAGVETAMDLRDARDYLIDELSSLAAIEYGELQSGMVWIKLEGTYLVTDSEAYHMQTYLDEKTGFKTPYWEELSNIEEAEKCKEDFANGLITKEELSTKLKSAYYRVFRIEGIDASKKNDVGKLKALLLTRGDNFATYLDIKGLNSYDYENYIANSVAMNTEAQFDTFVNNLVNAINDVVSPKITLGDSGDYDNFKNAAGEIVGVDVNGFPVTIKPSDRVLDLSKACMGSDNRIPPHEMFTRSGCDRFAPIVVTDAHGNKNTVYLFNEEDPEDLSKCYTTGTLHVNEALVKDPTRIGYKYSNGNIAYDMSANFTSMWDKVEFQLSPSDTTPCNLSNFYVKLVGDLSNRGYIYKTNNETLFKAQESLEDKRQGVVGVSSDEELVSMIRFQNAYNASSRYMSVISQMIEHLVTSLGSR